MDQKSRSRANSVIGQIKWWSSSTAPDLSNNNNNNNNLNNTVKQFGSSVAVQKLRESKWFGPDESRIFCAVIECGFIVETREGQENDGWFGIVICKTTKDKKPKPENVDIYTLKISDKRCKVVKWTLVDVWNQGFIIRINNFGDKEKSAHSEKDIKNQLSFAQKAKQTLWNNSQHFVTWCRYGDRQQDIRRRQVSDCMRWGNVGMNAGLIMVMQRQKSYSMSAAH